MVVIETDENRREVRLPENVMGDRAAHFPLDFPAQRVIDFYQAHLENMNYYGDAWPKWWPDFGPGIVAGYLGAQVKRAPETIWFDPPEEHAIDRLHLTYAEANPWWQRTLELTRAAVESWGDRVCIGFTDLGGNLDILASFRTTQQLLLDLYDAPEEVSRLRGEITRAWLRYYGELLAIIQQTGRGTTPWAYIWSLQPCYMLQSDFAYMISPKMFERFVLPDIAACCENIDHAFYHLDGKGQIPHLDMLLSLERLQGVQWIPGDGSPPPENWLPLLKRIREAGKLCQINLSFEGARQVVGALGGKGFAIWIKDPGEITAEDAADMVKTLVREGQP